jgi:hypothetical protein
VAAAIAANAQGVAVSVVLWAGAEQHETAVDWALLTDASTSARFADGIHTALAVDPDLAGKTAIGDALYFALESLDANGWDGVRRKIGVSGDGHANKGFKSEPVRDFAVRSGVTINGLAISNDEPYLEQYYRDHVIGGLGAFVMAAGDYQDFVEAIRRKLLQDSPPQADGDQPSPSLRPRPRGLGATNAGGSLATVLALPRAHRSVRFAIILAAKPRDRCQLATNR